MDLSTPTTGRADGDQDHEHPYHDDREHRGGGHRVAQERPQRPSSAGMVTYGMTALVTATVVTPAPQRWFRATTIVLAVQTVLCPTPASMSR